MKESWNRKVILKLSSVKLKNSSEYVQKLGAWKPFFHVFYPIQFNPTEPNQTRLNLIDLSWIGSRAQYRRAVEIIPFCILFITCVVHNGTWIVTNTTSPWPSTPEWDIHIPTKRKSVHLDLGIMICVKIWAQSLGTFKCFHKNKVRQRRCHSKNILFVILNLWNGSKMVSGFFFRVLLYFPTL